MMVGIDTSRPTAVRVNGRAEPGPEKSAPKPAFRVDVHGLRGVAVLLVLGFHCQLPWLRHGFLGVDMFFLISGHLIGKQVSHL